jgi:glucokinase
MASRTAITRDLAAAVKQGHTTVLTKMVGKDLTVARSGDLLEALNKHDKLTEKVIKRAAKYLGYGIASAVNLLDPDIIILGGGVVEALGNLLIDHAVKIARPNILADVARATPIVRATLGDDAGMLGAALIAKALLTESPGNES